MYHNGNLLVIMFSKILVSNAILLVYCIGVNGKKKGSICMQNDIYMMN